MLPTKFRVNWSFGSGEEAKSRFSRWPPYPILRDSRTPRNSGTNFKLEGENVVGYRYITHLYCLATGFYSDVVECRTLSPTDRV